MQKRCVNHMSLRPLRRLFCFSDLLISWNLPSALSPPTYHHTINKKTHRHPLGCIHFLHFWFNLLISKGHKKPENLNSWQRKKSRRGKPFSGWLWSYYVWGASLLFVEGLEIWHTHITEQDIRELWITANEEPKSVFVKWWKPVFFFPLNSWQFTAPHPNLFGALQP